MAVREIFFSQLIRCVIPLSRYPQFKVFRRADEKRPGRRTLHRDVFIRLSELPVVRMCVPPAPIIALVTVVHHGDINISAVTFFQVAPIGAVFTIVPLHLNTADRVVKCSVVRMRVPPRPVLRLYIASTN
jgi:hypothetical protein